MLKFILPFIIILSACSSTTTQSETPKGVKIDVNVQGYEDMCEREPESIFCEE